MGGHLSHSGFWIALVALLLRPEPAAACGLCMDVGLLNQSWWITGLHYLALALVLEFLVFGVAARVAKLELTGRARWLVGAVVLAIGFGVVGGGSAYAVSLGFVLCMAIRFGQSVRENARSRPRWAGTRVAAVIAIVGLGLLSTRPAARSTTWLVSMVDGLIHRPEIPAHLAPTSWAEEELAGRADAAKHLMARLERIEPNPGEHHRNRTRVLRLLRAHTIAGGEAAERHAACARLGVEPSWHELVGGMHAARVCGFATAEPATLASRDESP